MSDITMPSQGINKKYVKGFKYRLKPTKTQRDYFEVVFGHCRFVYNQILDSLIKQYDFYMSSGTTSLNRNKDLKPHYDITSLNQRLNDLKSLHPFLKDVSSVALQQSIRHLSVSFSNFFKSITKVRKGQSGHPSFKSKLYKQSFTLMTNGFRLITLKDSNVQSLLIGRLKSPIQVLWSRPLPSKPTSLTITKESNGDYYVSFTCEYIPTKTNGTNITGLDLGIKNYITDSNGNAESSMNSRLDYITKKIESLQRTLSRKVKNSMSFSHAKQRLARWYKKLRNVRDDYLHKLSRRLVNENQVIVVETLNVKGMVRNHCLARRIQDSAWSRFVTFLQYKVIESQHTILAKADTFYPSSKLCNVCNSKNAKLRLNDRQWQCTVCNTVHERDYNAATNLKNLWIGLSSHYTDLPKGSIVLLPNV